MNFNTNRNNYSARIKKDDQFFFGTMTLLISNIVNIKYLNTQNTNATRNFGDEFRVNQLCGFVFSVHLICFFFINGSFSFRLPFDVIRSAASQ
jgi:uncharacterized membrane protein YciS (DUF1049 family)